MLKPLIFGIIVTGWWYWCSTFQVTYKDGHVADWPLHAKLITTFMIGLFSWGALKYKERREDGE
jgi:hypothetical protein